jgi:hypothetical protein
LFLPLAVPVLLAAVKASTLVMNGDPMWQADAWTLMLVAFSRIFWPLCGVLFSRVVDDKPPACIAASKLPDADGLALGPAEHQPAVETLFEASCSVTASSSASGRAFRSDRHAS